MNRLVQVLAVFASLVAFGLSNTSHAQIEAETSVRTVITSASSYEHVGDYIFLPEDETITTVRAGLVKYTNTDGYKITIKASNKSRDPIPVEKVSDESFLVLGIGKIWVDFVGINFEKQDFVTIQSVVDIGQPDPVDPDPTPDPDPVDPDIPDDEFGNISRRVDQWASGLPNRKSVASHYRAASSALIDDLTKTVDDVGSDLASSIKEESSFSEYKDFFTKLDEDLLSRWPFAPNQRGNLSNYFRQVAIGLEAGE